MSVQQTAAHAAATQHVARLFSSRVRRQQLLEAGMQLRQRHAGGRLIAARDQVVDLAQRRGLRDAAQATQLSRILCRCCLPRLRIGCLFATRISSNFCQS